MNLLHSSILTLLTSCSFNSVDFGKQKPETDSKDFDVEHQWNQLVEQQSITCKINFIFDDQVPTSTLDSSEYSRDSSSSTVELNPCGSETVFLFDINDDLPQLLVMETCYYKITLFNKEHVLPLATSSTQFDWEEQGDTQVANAQVTVNLDDAATMYAVLVNDYYEELQAKTTHMMPSFQAPQPIPPSAGDSCHEHDRTHQRISELQSLIVRDYHELHILAGVGGFVAVAIVVVGIKMMIDWCRGPQRHWYRPDPWSSTRKSIRMKTPVKYISPKKLQFVSPLSIDDSLKPQADTPQNDESDPSKPTDRASFEQKWLQEKQPIALISPSNPKAPKPEPAADRPQFLRKSIERSTSSFGLSRPMSPIPTPLTIDQMKRKKRATRRSAEDFYNLQSPRGKQNESFVNDFW